MAEKEKDDPETKSTGKNITVDTEGKRGQDNRDESAIRTGKIHEGGSTR